MLTGKEIKSLFGIENNRKACGDFIRLIRKSSDSKARNETGNSGHDALLEKQKQNPAMNYFMV